LLKNIFMIRASYRFSKGKTTKKLKKDIEKDNDKKSGNKIF